VVWCSWQLLLANSMAGTVERRVAGKALQRAVLCLFLELVTAWRAPMLDSGAR